jgi:hypothetical protein
VSNTGPVCPLKRGICSGSLPFSLTGITANAPPPLASQLTARYSGFAWIHRQLGPLPQEQARGTNLHQIGIPRIATDVQVVVARFLPRRLPEYMSCPAVSLLSCLAQGNDEAYDTSTRARTCLPSRLNERGNGVAGGCY